MAPYDPGRTRVIVRGVPFPEKGVKNGGLMIKFADGYGNTARSRQQGMSLVSLKITAINISPATGKVTSMTFPVTVHPSN